MTPHQAKNRHVELHRAFDELFACYIDQNRDKTNFLGTTLKEFMDWSYEMTKKPTCAENSDD